MTHCRASTSQVPQRPVGTTREEGQDGGSGGVSGRPGDSVAQAPGDLWGPLILCVTLALMLQRGSVDSEKDGGPQFAEVFVILWFGAVTITLNSKLLGGNISFFQSLCVLGYCILPLTVAMLICRLVLLAEPGPVNFTVRLFVVIVMFAWSIAASTAFLADSQPPNRKALAVYPVFLFYFVISWMILTFTPQ
ncbi:PREDICTED: protein YIPF6 isoform X2 [Chinchilla lanigera]|uniref:protein YIPF6 isoform X2 n=1 Tax=Chinchilla lanigera TaxID=34839 RepID=UPI0006961981|nr:PREDICTED: protein YIPF6 isoform X2 [Chinchilla lanigera]